ncbi:hypothetical protein ALC60_06664, partial [Trachymyrmex zeteki]
SEKQRTDAAQILTQNSKAFDEQTAEALGRRDSQGRLVLNEYDRDANGESALIRLSRLKEIECAR